MYDQEKHIGETSVTDFQNVHTVTSHQSLFIINDDRKVSDYIADDVSELERNEVKRSLKPRQISMIAIGGTIGTGLFISTGNTLANAGPASSLISFFFMTSLAYSVTQSLGEMATYIPITGSFTQFVARWCSPAAGAANGWNYWFSWAITYALELSVVGQVIQVWTDKVPLAAWIAIFFVILLTINLFPVKFYGEIEFTVASIKVIAIVGWLLYALCTVCGTGSTGPIGFRYWRNPGAFGPANLVHDKNTAKFLGWMQSLISAAFTFQGTETVGIAAGESRNPRKTLPSAIRKVLFRILVFYVLCMFFLGLLVPYDDPRLGPNITDSSDTNYTSSSPFIIAMKISGTKVLPDIFNAVILTTIISAGNSNVYIGSRILYALAESKVAPRWFLKTSKGGVPYVAVLFTASFGALGFLAVSESGNNAFNWLLSIAGTAGLITWGWISYSHIRFMAILRHRNINRESLPFKATLMPYSAYYACVLIVIIIFIQGFAVFINFDVSTFFANYVSVMLFVACWVGFHFIYNGFTKKAFTTLFLPLEDCDIETGVRNIDDLDEDEPEPTNLWGKFWAMIA